MPLVVSQSLTKAWMVSQANAGRATAAWISANWALATMSTAGREGCSMVALAQLLPAHIGQRVLAGHRESLASKFHCHRLVVSGRFLREEQEERQRHARRQQSRHQKSR